MNDQRSTTWAYRGLWKILSDWFRVPEHPPDLPAVGDEPARSFRPDRGFLNYLRAAFFIIFGIVGVFWVLGLVAVMIALAVEQQWVVAVIVSLLWLSPLVVFGVLAFVALHMRYDTTWYAMTDRSLRIRRGIWSIREVSVTFENVQNVKVAQGPLQRHFGIANLVVETAGAGSGGSGHASVANQACIEGVTNAEALRDSILARLRQSTTAGLGDEEHEAAAPGWSAKHVAVLREILGELTRPRTDPGPQNAG